MRLDEYRTISFDRRGRVLTVALNRPEALNTVNLAMHEELAQVFYDAADDSGSDVVVLTGNGKAFCAGGDIKWLRDELESPTPFVHESRIVRKIVHGLLDCPKPVIARVNGDAYGLGATLALLCDMIVAADTARFADPHVRIGLVAGDGGALVWPQLVGFARAKQYLLTGDAVAAPDAERMGLINFAVPAQELDAVVGKYADKLVAGAQVAIRYTKSVVNIALRQLFDGVFEAGVAYEGLTKETKDFREGVTAFIEKRRPKFGEG